MSDARDAALHVVAGVLFDARGRVLIAQRPEGKVLAGRWEFPGGKVAPSESPIDALERELREELGVTALAAERLMYYGVDYPGRTIWLDVWRVQRWTGSPQGLDGQALAWIEPQRLHEHDILEADRPVIAALRAEVNGDW